METTIGKVLVNLITELNGVTATAEIEFFGKLPTLLDVEPHIEKVQDMLADLDKELDGEEE